MVVTETPLATRTRFAVSFNSTNQRAKLSRGNRSRSLSLRFLVSRDAMTLRCAPWDRILSLLKHYRNGRARYRNVGSIAVTVIDKRSRRYFRERLYERNCSRINSNYRCHRRAS